MAKYRYKYRLSNVSEFSQADKSDLADKVKECLLVRNLSAVETQKELSITEDALRYIQREFNIRKTRKQITETMQRTNMAKFGTPYFDRAESGKLTIYRFKQLSVADQQYWLNKFETIYKQENRSLSEVSELLNITNDTAIFLISIVGSKSKDLRISQMQKASMKKFGTLWPTQSEAIKKKTADTCMTKWGTSCYLTSEECKNKNKQWSIDHYGVDHPFRSTEFREKCAETMLDRYGVKYTAQSDELRRKMQNTCKQRYGSEHYHSSEAGKLHMQQVSLLSHGNSPEVVSLLTSEKLLGDFIMSMSPEERFVANIARKIGCDPTTLRFYIHKYHNLSDIVYEHEGGYCHSYLEDDIYEFVNSLAPAQRQYKRLIYPQEVDIYVPSCNFAIEVNGIYWHSDKFGRDSNYHRDKSIKVEATGNRLYHIFEYEWKNTRTQKILKSQIKNALGLTSSKIYARKCNIRSLSAVDCREFLDDNHIQGFRSSSVYLGLFLANTLVAVLTLGKPYFSNSYEWEIYRYCSLTDTLVIGGFGKLFKHFIRQYAPSTVLTYSDNAKGTGEVYRMNGFKLIGTTSPNYVWAKEYEVRSRYQCQMPNEREHMEALGFLRVYDCGSKKWVWYGEEIPEPSVD